MELNVFLVILGGLVLLFTRGFDQVWPIASLVIVASTIVFGLTARPFTKIYARYRAQEEGG